jgi:hypothetical protein
MDAYGMENYHMVILLYLLACLSQYISGSVWKGFLG